VYGLGGALNKLLGIILLPIYTRFLTPADYGILALLLVSGNIVLVLMQGGLGPAVFRETLYGGGDEEHTLGTALRYQLVQGVALTAVLVVAAQPIAGALLGSTEYGALLRLVFLTSLLQSVDTLALARFRMRRQAGAYVTLASAKFTSGVLLNIIFIAVLRRGVQGLVEASLLNSALFALCYLAVLRGGLHTRWSTATIRRLLSFGLPLVPAGLAATAMMALDRYLLRVLATTEEVGWYSLGYSVGIAVSLAVQAVQLAWPTEALPAARRREGPEIVARLVRYYLVGVGFCALSVSLFAREILTLLATPAFHSAAVVIPFIAFAHLLNGMRLMTNIGVSVKSKVGYTAAVALVTLGANVVLNLEMIPRWGMLGAAAATLASHALQLAMSWTINVRIWPVPYEYARLLRIAATIGGTFALGWVVGTGVAVGDVGVKLALLAAYPFALYALRVFDRSEWDELRLLIRRSTA
jgi:O-antigen/teichoic acid export membrane protein